MFGWQWTWKKEGGKKRELAGEWIHVYVSLSPFTLHLKLSQHCLLIGYQFSSVQLLSRVRLFATPWTPAHQASLSFTISQSSLKLMSIESVMPSNHLVLYCPFFSCLQSFLTSESFPVSHLFTPGNQSIGASASASVLPMNIQG